MIGSTWKVCATQADVRAGSDYICGRIFQPATGLRLRSYPHNVQIDMRSSFRLKVFTLTLIVLLTSGVGRAQEIVLPAPLAPKNLEAPPASAFAMQIAAQRALEMGFPSVAVDLHQRLIDNQATKPELRNKLIVDQATALLEDDRIDEAGAALKNYIGLPSSAYQLRQAMVALREVRYSDARAVVAAIAVDQLSSADRSWYYYVQGKLADAVRDFAHSGTFYQQAIDASEGELQRAKFTLEWNKAKLQLGDFSEQRAAELKQQLDKYSGRQLYAAVYTYAVGLTILGKQAEAASILQRQLQALPMDERTTSDEWRLLLGLISGAGDGVGRNALGALLATGVDRAKQRVALQMLARSSRSGANRDDFRRRLDELVSAPSQHPLLEDLLLFRAQVALSEKNYSRSETDANRLLEQYPGSQYNGLARGILTGTFWELGRYRNAANQATKAREVLPAGETRAQLGVMVAESWFRAGLGSRSAPDFRNAADAYAVTLDEVPTGVSPGLLMFQRLVSEVEVANADEGKGDRFARAQSLLDQMALDPRFDSVNRWQAEWNLSRALEAAGEIVKAYDRLNRLMGTNSDTTKLPVDLKAQLGWLRANLSYRAGDPARTLTLADTLLDSLENVEAGLRSQIASMTMLLQAQANYGLAPSRPDDALERLRKLRAEYPRADATVYSFLVEAEELARKGQLVEAQNLLRKLADDFPKNDYAPYALYQDAQYAERRGQVEKYLTDAYKILESLTKNYPKSDLVFYAKLKQGNLLRQTNDYPAAQNMFEGIVNDFPQHQDVLSAKLALADCHAAQAASDASHQESAATIYESLLDLQSAPPDIRAEAGYKFGLILSRRNNGSAAIEVWGRLLTSVLPDDSKAEALGSKGRVWISKTLLDMGDLFEQQHKPEEAREAYDKIIRKALPYVTLAQKRLAALRTQRTP